MLKSLQAGTGLMIAAFLTVHLVNTWMAAFGARAYDSVQVVVRAVYQFAPLEALLLAAIAVHAVVGVMRIVGEPRRTLTWRARVHRYAGFFLLVVIVGHVVAVRGASMFFGVYPGFGGLAFTVDFLPVFFYPYYFLLAVFGFYHAVNGSSIAAGRLGARIYLPRGALATGMAVATVATIFALLAFGGVTQRLYDPADNDFARLALELLE